MTFSDWSRTPPTRECYAIFRGLRVTGSGRASQLHEFVQVKEIWRGNKRELAVARMGRQELTPLTACTGEWQEWVL